MVGLLQINQKNVALTQSHLSGASLKKFAPCVTSGRQFSTHISPSIVSGLFAKLNDEIKSQRKKFEINSVVPASAKSTDDLFHSGIRAGGHQGGPQAFAGR